MPLNFHYPPILSLISAPRLASYSITFTPGTDSELYGIYIWAQHVVGALYPILQNIEISLRNAIDAEARQRFGEFYWRLPQFNTPQTIDFSNNLRKAESQLNAEWRTHERRRRGLISGTLAWSHDKIVAATDFSTWSTFFVMIFPHQIAHKNLIACGPVPCQKYFANTTSSTRATYLPGEEYWIWSTKFENIETDFSIATKYGVLPPGWLMHARRSTPFARR